MQTQELKRKGFAIGTLFVLFGAGLAAVSTHAEKTRGRWWYVGGSGPGNYTRIQEAVNASTDGDTVFVYNGTYYEHVTMNKMIHLLGQHIQGTVIDGGGTGIVVWIGANATISGFTIQHSGNQFEDAGILSYNRPNVATNFHAYGNLIRGNSIGVYLFDSDDDTITGNIIRDNEVGISLYYVNRASITGNNFIDNTNHSTFWYFFGLQRRTGNVWDGNYWDTWRSMLPRPIRGTKEWILIVLRPGTIYGITIPWFNFDRHPAKTPFDIG
ncbi:MAG TPA: NosD domain-containing protein [Candidatus Thermoplasmatota archaeon]|nr:NosD domain-containing protein [Candidatus Thermoplasmatota archaeon]